ncbi:hypothetical protein FQN53_007495 [Emmonsiellopsis sp. PD_33]|nr:hypothetical protein FQN53_007495 [Emmonsiellopsis sp. PD_33]KAK2802354.1 hypothetical protein FQN51_004648 [Onygenales sp. PD_10]
MSLSSEPPVSGGNESVENAFTVQQLRDSLSRAAAYLHEHHDRVTIQIQLILEGAEVAGGQLTSGTKAGLFVFNTRHFSGGLAAAATLLKQALEATSTGGPGEMAVQNFMFWRTPSDPQMWRIISEAESYKKDEQSPDFERDIFLVKTELVAFICPPKANARFWMEYYDIIERQVNEPIRQRVREWLLVCGRVPAENPPIDPIKEDPDSGCLGCCESIGKLFERLLSSREPETWPVSSSSERLLS